MRNDSPQMLLRCSFLLIPMMLLFAGETEPQIGAIAAGHGPLVDSDETGRKETSAGLLQYLASDGLDQRLVALQMAGRLVQTYPLAGMLFHH